MCGIHVELGPVAYTPESSELFNRPVLTEQTRVSDRILACLSSDLTLARRGPDGTGTVQRSTKHGTTVTFRSSVLQLRGHVRTKVPLCSETTKNVLVFNGEIYTSGNRVVVDSDSKWLLAQLDATEGDSVLISKLLSAVRGPWSLVYWHHKTHRLWIAKDIVGRRSLLLCLPSSSRGYLSVCSVVPREAQVRGHDWFECPPGIFSFDANASRTYIDRCAKYINKSIWLNHIWRDHKALLLFFFRRGASGCSTEECEPYDVRTKRTREYEDFIRRKQASWYSLDRSVQLRSVHCRIPLHESISKRDKAYFGVLFSGGLDCTILCALLHRNLQADEIIDLCSVCFDGGRSPDRKAARSALAELERVCPGRNWRFIEVNVHSRQLSTMRQYIESLIYPSKSAMDFNISAALWFAAKGAGTIKSDQQSSARIPYQTSCRIILSGQGADELCGGYTRHRNIFKSFGNDAFEENLRLDTLRIWQRNLGRDDRILSDHGREARFPYLDEDFMLSILKTPVHEIAELTLPPGIGDKKCLRELALHLGLSTAARRIKKAIQFDSKASLYEHHG